MRVVAAAVLTAWLAFAPAAADPAYLADPVRIVPNTAAAMPEIGNDGKRWTIRLRPGIRFTDDPKMSEVVAAYSPIVYGLYRRTRFLHRRPPRSDRPLSPAPVVRRRRGNLQ